jgi:hypothetical protein
MVESPDFLDPLLGIPVFSLYGEVRRPTPAMMDSFDVLLVDLETLEQKIEAQDERTSPSVWRALKAEFLRALNQPL